MKFTKTLLEKTYKKYNRKEFVHPDPLEFLDLYDNDADKEIVGLIASSLAYGRVAQILKSVAKVLDRIGPPVEFVSTCSEAKARRLFKDYKHRFTTGEEMAALLYGMGTAIKEHGSLNACFESNDRDDIDTVAALSGFTKEIDSYSKHGNGSLIPNVEKGSACKRLFLYLRWMVRNDDVDPGCWSGVSPAKLIIPLDTHMHRIGLEHGLTLRKNTGIRTAQEITQGFAKFSPKDPVKYDFALTRPGIAGV